MNSVDAHRTTKGPRSKPKWRPYSSTNASSLCNRTNLTASKNYPHSSTQVKTSTASIASTAEVQLKILKVDSAWLRPFLFQIY